MQIKIKIMRKACSQLCKFIIIAAMRKHQTCIEIKPVKTPLQPGLPADIIVIKFKSAVLRCIDWADEIRAVNQRNIAGLVTIRLSALAGLSCSEESIV